MGYEELKNKLNDWISELEYDEKSDNTLKKYKVNVASFIEFMKDKDYLNRIIVDEYMELGKSGKLYTKEDEIRAFGEMTEDRDITIYNYSCMKLSEDVFLIHYYTSMYKFYF